MFKRRRGLAPHHILRRERIMFVSLEHLFSRFSMCLRPFSFESNAEEFVMGRGFYGFTAKIDRV